MCVFSSFQVASGKCSAEECIEKLNILHFRENPPPKTYLFKEYASEGNEDVVLVP
jgi:hypothetical protein